MHQRDALPEGSVEDGLALLDFHFDAQRLEPNLMYLNVCHHPGSRRTAKSKRAAPRDDLRPGGERGPPKRPSSGLLAQWQGLILKPLRYSAVATSRSIGDSARNPRSGLPSWCPRT